MIACRHVLQSQVFLKAAEVAASLQQSTIRMRFGSRASTTLLKEVGRLQKPLDPDDISVSYKTGQLFLHKQLGYRGVILIPWKTNIFESSKAPILPIKDHETERSVDILCGDFDRPCHEERGAELFYNVLVDATDSSYVRASLDGVSFLGRDAERNLVITLPGVDLVHQEEVVPYRLSFDSDGHAKEFPPDTSITNTLLHHLKLQTPPIQHELFPKFFQPEYERDLREPAHRGTAELHRWRRRNRRWLKPKAAFRAENPECGVRVTVIPFYMGSLGGGGRGGGGEEREEGRVKEGGTLQERRYWWRYILRVENLGDRSLLIKSRSWSFSTQKGTFETRSERGLEGQNTVLSPWNRCTQITCYCILETSSGSTWGQFELVDDKGKTYECLIPHFSLQAHDE